MVACGCTRICRQTMHIHMRMCMRSSPLHSSAILHSSSSSSLAAAGYRRLLRASRVAFKDHEVAISDAREELRRNFYMNKDVTDETELKKLLIGIDEVEEMLKFNIVQGKRNERGNYGK